jgi:hypothetical protein
LGTCAAEKNAENGASDEEYNKILQNLNPQKVYDELCEIAGNNEPVLLCWEVANEPYHRRRVAE